MKSGNLLHFVQGFGREDDLYCLLGPFSDIYRFRGPLIAIRLCTLKPISSSRFHAGIGMRRGISSFHVGRGDPMERLPKGPSEARPAD